jgi:hypothetical protein
LLGNCKNNAISRVRSIKYMKLSLAESFNRDYRRFRKDIMLSLLDSLHLFSRR